MNLLRPALPTHRKSPTLLHMPQHDKENQPPTMPLLKVNLSNGNDKKGTNIFRLPTEYCNLPIIFQQEKETSHPAHAPIPKLIDIRSVINPIRNEKIRSPLTKKVVSNKDIKLIKLPLVKSETHRLLDSPKRKMSDVSRQKVLDKEQPLLVDIRPYTPQSPQSTQLLKNVKTCKCKPVASSMNSSRRTSVKSPSHTVNKLTQTDDDDDDLSIVNESHSRCKRKHKKRNKHHSEEQLYEVISELLMEHHKRKKHKRIGLFDIIDNIPLSSESEIDDIQLVQSRRARNENIQSFSQKISTRNEPIETDVKTMKPSRLPDYTLDKYKPKSTFLENKDALSWANIIKAARQETQATQTERKIGYMMKSQEIQTEMRGMVEIPRTQTFYKSESVAKTTNEFYDRVRQEVVEKLDNLKKKEDKFCQTICNAGVQTDEEIETFNNDDVRHIPIKGTEIPSQKKGQISYLPPDIHTEVYFQKKETGVNKEFINIVDLHDVNENLAVPHKVSFDFFKLESIDEYVARMSALVTEGTGEQGLTVENEKAAIEKASTGEAFEEQVDLENLGDVGTIEQGVSMKDEQIAMEKTFSGEPKKVDLENIFPSTSIAGKHVKKKKKAKKFKSSKDTSGKVILKDNINEFSVGLDALNEIHENLEKELRHSKFLYGVIESLQDGFISDSSQEIQTSDDSTSEDKLLEEEDLGNAPEVHLSKSTARPYAAGLLDEVSNSDEMLVSCNEDEDVRLPFDSLEQYSPSPRYYDNERGKVRCGSTLVSRSCTSRLEILESIRSYEETTEVSKVESMKDKLYKQELQLKICKTMTSDELRLKQEAEKRSKLLKWIQKKKSERQKQYLEDLGLKREAEHHPFVSKSNVSARAMKHNISTQAQITKSLLQENNQERLQSAERLATSVISKRPAASKGKIELVHGKHANNRYNRTTTQSFDANNAPPIPETRASRIRKSALMSHISKNQQLRKNSDGKPKRKRRVAKPINENKKKSKKIPASVVKPSSRSATRKKDSRKSDERFDFRGHHSVEARDFVTRESYDDYVMKSSKILHETMHEYEQFDDDSYYMLQDVDFQNQLFTSSRMSLPIKDIPSIEFKNQESSTRLSPNCSLNSSTNNNEVKGLLTRYGMNVDKGLFEKTSGTSQLLVEVDLALLEDSDVNNDVNSLVSEKIDWDEIDKILDE